MNKRDNEEHMTNADEPTPSKSSNDKCDGSDINISTE